MIQHFIYAEKSTSSTNTTITWPMILNGNISGTGITTLMGGYASSTDLNTKESSITVAPPLVKTVATGVNRLSLDTTAKYTLGTVYVSGGTILQTSATGDVAIVNRSLVDIMRVTDDGNINLQFALTTLTPAASGGLIMSSNTHGASVWFRDNLDVSFFGSKVLCSAATLTALKLISTSGLTATYGTNVLDVNATNTTITGPVILNGSISGSGITQLLSTYLTSASINGKEDSITVSAPLLKTTPTIGTNAGKNVLYLDTTAAYTVGNLTANGVVSGIGFTN